MTPEQVRQRLPQLIQEGETAWMEFKRQFPGPDKMAREISALANTAGGWIVVGIDDQGHTLGVEDPPPVLTQIEAVYLYSLDPPLPEVQALPLDYQDRSVIVVEVPNSPQKPHQLAGDSRWSGQVYLRHHSFTLPIDADMIKLLRSRDESQIHSLCLGKLERALVDYLQEHPQITLQHYCRWVNISERRGQRILITLLQAGILNRFQQQQESYYGLNPLWCRQWP